MITIEACTGCGACAVSCPQNCIQMQFSRSGQLMPKVDPQRCTKCGVCVNTCPQKAPATMLYPQKCYAAWSKDPEDLVHSASGGIGATFARMQMHRGGAAYGCDYSPDGDLQHFQLRTIQDLERIRGSKYSQSSSWMVFPEIRKLLREGMDVLFVGTPCQVAGLRKYLRKDYPQLITVDLVCHGTPSNAYLKQYLKHLGISFPVDRITFRGEFDQKLTVWKDGKICHQKAWKDDAYFAAFYGNIISNAACYTCPYAQAKRVSDITIGDFWGLGELVKLDSRHPRPSLVLINTEKGQSFFEAVSEQLNWEQRSVEEGICGNGRLISPPGTHETAEIFRKVYTCKVFGFYNSLRVSYKIAQIRTAFQQWFKILMERLKIRNDT